MNLQRHGLPRLLLLVFLVLSLAACGSAPTPPGGGGPKPKPTDPIPNPPETSTLSIEGLTLTPSLAPEGGSVLVAFTVHNRGADAVPASTTVLRLNGSAREVRTGDAVLAELATPQLQPGDAKAFSEMVALGGTPLGAYFLWVLAGAEDDTAHAAAPLGVALPACEAPQVVVDIPDASLRQYLTEALTVSGELRCGAMHDLLTFEFGGFGKPKVGSLVGMQHAANLTELIMQGQTELEDLTPLQGLTGLTSLTASNLAVKDVAPLSQLRNLSRLDLSWNYEIEDLAPLKYLTGLKELDLYYSLTAGKGIGEIVPLLTQLTDLNIGWSNLTDIEMIRGMTGLTKLNVGWNSLASIEPLAGLTNLTELNVGKSGTSDLSALSALVNLTTLGVRLNSVTSLSPLAAMTDLRKLDAGSNEVNSLAGLEGLTRLEELNLSSNDGIADITALAGLTAMTDLDLSGNAVEDIGTLQHLTGLKTLELSDNRISDIGVLTGLAALEEVDLSENCLDETPGSAASQVITELKNRGVTVWASFQGDGCD